MKRFTSRKAVAVVAAGLVVAGAGSALAASGSGSGTSFLDRVAQKLGISSEKLRDATKAAAIDQIDEQLKAGTITKEQADAMKKRVEAGQIPGLGGFGDRGFGDRGFGRHGGHRMGGPGMGGPGMGGPGGHLADAATYLGLTEAKLVEQLQAGKSLADVAKAQGKTVDGLKDALLASEKKELDALVKAGTITQAQADSALAARKSHLDDMVNGTFRGGPGGRGMGRGFGDRDGDHGPVMPGGQRMMPGGASLGAPA